MKWHKYNYFTLELIVQSTKETWDISKYFIGFATWTFFHVTIISCFTTHKYVWFILTLLLLLQDDQIHSVQLYQLSVSYGMVWAAPWNTHHTSLMLWIQCALYFCRKSKKKLKFEVMWQDYQIRHKRLLRK